MPFIIPDHTICPICNCPIKDNTESLVLPYVDTNKYPRFQKFPRAYVHRVCFRNWKAKQEYVDLSIDLKRNVQQDPDCIFYEEYITIIRQDFLERFVIQDSKEIVEIEISFNLSKNIPQFLDFIQDSQQKSFVLGDIHFSKNDGDMQIEDFQNEKQTMKLCLPKDRILAWEKALRHLLSSL